jgi:hypothetical protein
MILHHKQYPRLLFVILVIAQVLNPLAPSIFTATQNAKAADAPAHQSSAVQDLSHLPPLSAWSLSGERSTHVDAPIALPAQDLLQLQSDPVPHYATSVATTQIYQTQDLGVPGAHAITLENPNYLLNVEDGQQTFFNIGGTRQYSDYACVVVTFGGTITMNGDAIQIYGQGVGTGLATTAKTTLAVAASDKVLPCNSDQWTPAFSTQLNPLTWYTGYYTGKVRSLRLAVYQALNNPFWERGGMVDAVRLYGHLSPDGTEGCNCSDGNTVQTAQNPSVGYSVNPRTGNHTYSRMDFVVSGRSEPLALRRIYSAQRSDTSQYQDTVFGPGWTHNYNMRLIFSGDPEGELGTVIFQEANGSRQRFGDDGNGNYVPDQGLLASLIRSGSAGNYFYTLVFADQVIYQFDNDGRLIKIDHTIGSGASWNPTVLSYVNRNVSRTCNNTSKKIKEDLLERVG